MIDHRVLVAGAILLPGCRGLLLATRRLRFPLLVTFPRAPGMLLGSEGFGGIYFDDRRARPARSGSSA